jgi:hypothetical protein
VKNEIGCWERLNGGAGLMRSEVYRIVFIAELKGISRMNVHANNIMASAA